jgi:hypothetical protein
MDTIDRITILVLAIGIGCLSYFTAKEYTDREICKLKNGIIYNGECVEVIRK